MYEVIKVNRRFEIPRQALRRQQVKMSSMRMSRDKLERICATTLNHRWWWRWVTLDACPLAYMCWEKVSRREKGEGNKGVCVASGNLELANPISLDQSTGCGHDTGVVLATRWRTKVGYQCTLHDGQRGKVGNYAKEVSIEWKEGGVLDDTSGRKQEKIGVEGVWYLNAPTRYNCYVRHGHKIWEKDCGRQLSRNRRW
jgi:hypothetical protein